MLETLDRVAETMPAFSADVLHMDMDREVNRIVDALRSQVLRDLRRRGLVVGMSGGIDSSVCAVLAVRAFGPDKVFGIFMPERDSDPLSLRLGQTLAAHLGIQAVTEDIAPMIAAMGCYDRRDAAIREVLPEYGADWKFKIVLPHATESKGYNINYLVYESASGETGRVRLPLGPYLGIVAATNMKQRTRKQTEYYHADRLNYAVVGTPNRLEYDQGFFVKNGDGSADVKPIAHLYKTQVYDLAAYLGLPPEIQSRQPTTDTYSLAQSQEEFYFALPYDKMDLCLYGLNHRVAPESVASAIGLPPPVVERVYQDIDQKRRTTRPLHLGPLLVEKVAEIV